MRPADRSATDAELIASIATGDLGGLGQLFERYEPDVRRLLARLVGMGPDVDDLVQLTFLDVPRAAARFDPSFPARPWLLGLAAVVARRHRRSVMRLANRLLAWAGAVRAPAVPLPSEIFEGAAAEAIVARALAELSPKKRDVLVLVVMEGLRGEDVAAALGIPVATVWTRLHHARRELRAALLSEEP